MDEVLAQGFTFAALDDGQLLGWIGGLPQYDGRVWELHPLVVRPERRLQGIGRALAASFEDEARRRLLHARDPDLRRPAEPGTSRHRGAVSAD